MLDSILSDFVLDCRSRGYAKRTIESYAGHVGYFLTLYDIDSDYSDLRSFLVHIRDEKEYTLSTCSNYFAALSTFYDFLEFERIVDRNIIPSFRKRYMRSYKKNHVPESRQLISVEDMGRLIDTPDILAYRVLILFLAKTGIRRNELIMLDRENLDLDRILII